MAEEKNLNMALSVFEKLCTTLDKNGLSYEKNAEKLSVAFNARGEDLFMELKIRICADSMLILLVSQLPFVIPKDKRLDVAVAVSAVNNQLINGSFDYDIKNGNCCFRMTNGYADSLIGEDVFMYMIVVSGNTIDDYNDKLFMLSKGKLSIEEFLESIKF